MMSRCSSRADSDTVYQSRCRGVPFVIDQLNSDLARTPLSLSLLRLFSVVFSLFVITRGVPGHRGVMCGCRQCSNDIYESN